MVQRPDDDLFTESTMSFGEHLEELRKALIKALYGLMIGVAIGLYFGNEIVDWIKKPLEDGLRNYQTLRTIQELERENVDVSPELLATIEKEQMLPKERSVDPTDLFAKLHLESGAAQAGYHAYHFQADDFPAKSLPGLCRQLVAEGNTESSTPTVGQLLWPELSSSERDLLRRLAEASEISTADRQAVADLFNSAAESPAFTRQLYNAEDEDLAVDLDNATIQKLLGEIARNLAQHGAGDEQTADEASAAEDIAGGPQRLVRLLLPAAYPGYVEPYTLKLVKLTFWEPMDVAVTALGSSEVFMIWLKAGVVAGFIFASPWVFWQLWSFVAAGLYPHEKHYVYLYLPMSLGLFIGGVLLAYFFVFEYVLDFLFSFNLKANIPIEPRISEWLSFVLVLPLGFGLSFQMPLVMLFMERIGLFEVKNYVSKWRISIVVIFAVGMLFTPPDPLSMILMAIPLCGLYFLGIALCLWMPKRRNPFDELGEA